jgi:fumarate reductase subunit D
MIWFGFTATLKGLNSHFYGVSATIEMKTPEFKSAYGGLLRIKTDTTRRFYPVVSEARELAYQVSPAFARLKPFLEGDQGKQWIDLAHSDDFPAGFFIWAFRDAVAAAGYYQDSAQALELYRQIGREIDAACNADRLECRPRYTSLMPPWSRDYNKLLLPTFASIFKRIVHFQGFSADIEGIMSKGNAEMMQHIELITREQLRTSRMDKLKGYPEYHNHLNTEKIRILNDAGAFYQLIIPPLFYGSLALMLLLGLIPKTRRSASHFLVFYVSLLAGLCSIVFILSLVVLTSYASIHRAMHVSYPVVLIMIVCTLLAVFEIICLRRQEI